MAEPRTKRLLFILGGARSGKSATALRLARGAGERVLFAATAEAHDTDMAARIAAHKGERPAAWSTLEEPVELPAALRRTAPGHDAVVVDCLTLWVSNLLLRGEDDPGVERTIVERARDLLRVYDEGRATWIVVSNEVGLGVVPPSDLGRRYRDALGRVNQLVAAHADGAYLLVAGLVLDLKRLDTIAGLDA